MLDQIIWRIWKSTFDITQELILEHSEEILNVHTIESTSPSWTRSTLSHDQVIQWTKAKVRVYSDSVLYLVKMYDNRVAIKRLEGSSGRIHNVRFLQKIRGIDGEPIELEWSILPGFSSLQILQKIQNDLRERNIKPEEFTDRIMFMSIFNDIDWTSKGNDGICISFSEKVKEYAKRFSQGHWTFVGPGYEKKWYGTLLNTLEENGTLQQLKWWNDSKMPVI